MILVEKFDSTLDLPTGFQEQIVSTALSFVFADSVRFLIFSPRLSINQAVYSAGKIASMEEDYARHWRYDPMHPSLFEDSETKVVSNASLMSTSKWKQEPIFLNFFKPFGFFHDMDVFFRVEGKIVGVLTMLRSNENQPFTADELSQIQKIHPFIEYCMQKVFIPARIKDRHELMAAYALTLRELDVLEYALTGLSNKELVRHLTMGLPTLRTHLQSIYQKVGVHSTSELISKVLREIDFQSNF